MAYPITAAEHANSEAMIASLPELIVSAAVRCGDRIVTVERPGRHGDCINWLFGLGVESRDHGFLTSRGRFVDRLEAGKIAAAAGQATANPAVNSHLFSEDVWHDRWDEARAQKDPTP